MLSTKKITNDGENVNFFKHVFEDIEFDDFQRDGFQFPKIPVSSGGHR